MKRESKVKIDPKIKGLLPHELNTALALGRAGYCVEFIQRHNSLKTADALIDGTAFEFKSPEGTKIRTVEHIAKKAAKQCPNLVLDMRRMKHVQERSVQNFLIGLLRCNRIGLRKILFITRSGEVIDIGKFV